MSSVLIVTFTTTAMSAWVFRPLIAKITTNDKMILPRSAEQQGGAESKADTPVSIHMLSVLMRPIGIKTTIQNINPLKDSLHPYANAKIGNVEAYLDPTNFHADNTPQGKIRREIGNRVFGEQFMATREAHQQENPK
jgi:hypothetical protein